MDIHLGYKKNSNEGDNSGNSRNGYSKKTVLTQDQEVELNVPRDRNSEFEPGIVPKYSKRLPLFNDQIISLYSRGMNVRDIQSHLLNVSLMKVIKNKAAFPDDDAIMKVMYLAIQKASKKWTIPSLKPEVILKNMGNLIMSAHGTTKPLTS